MSSAERWRVEKLIDEVTEARQASNGKFRQYKIKARSKQQASRKAYDIMQEQKLYNMIVIGIVQWNEMFNGVGVDVD